MKKLLFLIISLCISLGSYAQTSLKGAWKLSMGDSETIFLATDSYLTYTMYNTVSNQFTQTWGGTYKLQGGNLEIKVEFNSTDSTEVGQLKVLKVRIVGSFLKISTLTFQQVDLGDETPVTGYWQISKRANQSGEMKLIEPSARKTIKILSGTYFQWVVMNTETGQFFGTGGGTYSYDSGIYTEKILFFSRDVTRVGKMLTFNAEVESENWIHSGKSSTGNPVKEIWTKNLD